MSGLLSPSIAERFAAAQVRLHASIDARITAGSIRLDELASYHRRCLGQRYRTDRYRYRRPA